MTRKTCCTLIDAQSGTREWTFETDGDWTGSAPTVVEETVFFGSGWHDNDENEITDTHVYAVDTETGEEVWRFETDSYVWSSPTVVDGVLYIGSADESLYALDAGVGGSSEDSRVSLGTYGHHEEWSGPQDLDIPDDLEPGRPADLDDDPDNSDGDPDDDPDDDPESGPDDNPDGDSDDDSDGDSDDDSDGDSDDDSDDPDDDDSDDPDDDPGDDSDGDETADDAGPGFGISGAVASLGGVTYMLSRRLRDEKESRQK